MIGSWYALFAQEEFIKPSEREIKYKDGRLFEGDNETKHGNIIVDVKTTSLRKAASGNKRRRDDDDNNPLKNGKANEANEEDSWASRRDQGIRWSRICMNPSCHKEIDIETI